MTLNTVKFCVLHTNISLSSVFRTSKYWEMNLLIFSLLLGWSILDAEVQICFWCWLVFLCIFRIIGRKDRFIINFLETGRLIYGFKVSPFNLSKLILNFICLLFLAALFTLDSIVSNVTLVQCMSKTFTVCCKKRKVQFGTSAFHVMHLCKWKQVESWH